MKPTQQNPLSYRIEPYVVDGHASQVFKEGKGAGLSPTEFEVFYQIVQRKGDVVLRREFLPWNREAGKREADRRHPVDEFVKQIRRKLDQKIIQTVQGRGYRLSATRPVEVIPSPCLSEAEQILTIALRHLNTHTGPGFQSSIRICEELLKRSEIPDAYVYIALAYINLGHLGLCRVPWSVAIVKAREILKRAFQWFPDFGSAYALRGLTYLTYEHDWQSASDDLERALKLSPENELAHCFMAHLKVSQGKFEEAVAHARAAARLDYENPVSAATVPWFILFAGHTEEALLEATQVVARFGPSPVAHMILGYAYCAAGMMKEAVDEYQQARKIEFLPDALASEGFVHGREGRSKEALGCLDTIRRAKAEGTIAYVSSYFEALIYWGLGEKKPALDALERAFEEKCDWLIYLAVEPRWKVLRDEKRFAGLLRRVGLKRTT